MTSAEYNAIPTPDHHRGDDTESTKEVERATVTRCGRCKHIFRNPDHDTDCDCDTFEFEDEQVEVVEVTLGHVVEKFTVK